MSDVITEVFLNQEGLLHIFKKGPIPTFSNVEVLNLNINSLEKTACLVFDLSEYPNHPPKKWQEINANVCQINLTLFALMDITVDNFCSPFTGQLQVIRDGDNLVRTEVQGKEVKIVIISEFVRVDKVSAYYNSR